MHARYHRVPVDDPLATSVTPLLKDSVPRGTRCLFSFFNVLYMFGGILSVICGGLAMLAFQSKAMTAASNWISSYGVLRNETLFTCAQMLTAAGAFSLFIAIYGFVLARNQRGAAITFSLLLGFSMFFHWMAAYSAYDAKLALSYLQKSMFHLQNLTQGNATSDRPTALFVNIQKEWKCCGVAEASEWLNNVNWFHQKYDNIQHSHPGKSVVVDGCCKEDKCHDCSIVTGSECKLSEEGDVYSVGCADTINQYLNWIFLSIAGVAVTSGCIEIIFLIIAVNLSTSFVDPSVDNYR